MSGWTPGPWQYVELTHEHVVEAASGRNIYIGPNDCDAEAKADAKLIAAAPELYVLLEAAEHMYSTNLLLANDVACGIWINDARAALARARGEA